MKQAEQLKLLNDMFNIISFQEDKTKEEAFCILMEFIAHKLDFEDGIPSPWLKRTTYDSLVPLYHHFVEIAKQHPWDWFGELHHLHQLSIIGGDYYVSKAEVEKQAIPLQPKSSSKVFRILDEVCCTGRNALYLNTIYPGAIFYLAEDNVMAYRITLMNVKLYNLRARVLNANSVNCDLRAFSPNWRYANRWNPVKKQKLFTEDETNERIVNEHEGFIRLV